MPSEDVFNRGMAILMSVYPDYECKPDTVDAYREFLQHMSNQEFEAAIKNHISQNKWFPKVSELLQATLDALPTPADVWSRLIAAAETGKKPEMDPATERALYVVGGWDKFCMTSYETLDYRFKDFKAELLAARASRAPEALIRLTTDGFAGNDLVPGRK
jgi:hypothetical protein